MRQAVQIWMNNLKNKNSNNNEDADDKIIQFEGECYDCEDDVTKIFSMSEILSTFSYFDDAQQPSKGYTYCLQSYLL